MFGVFFLFLLKGVSSRPYFFDNFIYSYRNIKFFIVIVLAQSEGVNMVGFSVGRCPMKCKYFCTSDQLVYNVTPALNRVHKYCIVFGVPCVGCTVGYIVHIKGK